MSSADHGPERNRAAECRHRNNSTGNDLSPRAQHEQTQTHGHAGVQPQIDPQAQALPQRSPEQESCRCLQRIVFLINELETGLTIDIQSDENDSNGVGADPLPYPSVVHDLDSALGLHKEAVRYGWQMQQCRQCSARPENQVFLLLLANRLAARCTHMVTAYCRHAAAQQSASSCYHYGYGSNAPPPVVITVGEYEVDSATESEAVLRVLIAFQLRALHSFASSLAGPHQPQGPEFAAVKNKVTTLLRRLHQGNSSLPVKPTLSTVR